MEQAIDAYVYLILLVFCCIIFRLVTGGTLLRFHPGSSDVARKPWSLPCTKASDFSQGKEENVDRGGAMEDYTGKGEENGTREEEEEEEEDFLGAA